MPRTRLQPRWGCLAGIAAVVITVGGWFQAAPPTSEVPVPTIRVSTHLVLVDVVVPEKGKTQKGRLLHVARGGLFFGGWRRIFIAGTVV